MCYIIHNNFSITTHGCIKNRIIYTYAPIFSLKTWVYNFISLNHIETDLKKTIQGYMYHKIKFIYTCGFKIISKKIPPVSNGIFLEKTCIDTHGNNLFLLFGNLLLCFHCFGFYFFHSLLCKLFQDPFPTLLLCLLFLFLNLF